MLSIKWKACKALYLIPDSRKIIYWEINVAIHKSEFHKMFAFCISWESSDESINILKYEPIQPFTQLKSPTQTEATLTKLQRMKVQAAQAHIIHQISTDFVIQD